MLSDWAIFALQFLTQSLWLIPCCYQCSVQSENQDITNQPKFLFLLPSRQISVSTIRYKTISAVTWFFNINCWPVSIFVVWWIYAQFIFLLRIEITISAVTSTARWQIQFCLLHLIFQFLLLPICTIILQPSISISVVIKLLTDTYLLF